MGSVSLAVGVDIIEIPRIARAVERWGERFLRRVYTPQEVAYCRGRVPELAARFAAKEAASKALGVGIWGRLGIRWTEAEVWPDSLGKPELLLHGRAAALARMQGLDRWAISLSHSHDYAVAMVVATGRLAQDRLDAGG